MPLQRQGRAEVPDSCELKNKSAGPRRELALLAERHDTVVGSSRKDDPRDVAHGSFDTMMSGGAGVVNSWKNKLETVLATIAPAARLAEKHRRIAKPGSARHQALSGHGRSRRDGMAWTTPSAASRSMSAPP
ncbi:hypothetical protein FHP25_29160 [Vineibacter terrae]|uniref:Uncharacterized protein n=1 Tax=Vineibacter terrae TaxID=2586908 RepID=A0A5C8PDH3_9HYPH|nr:hypothetical protein [Vineibacter terrae]TXL71609.1 hypothetical protein FHP25_29160 [Vineibacter terrae]